MNVNEIKFRCSSLGYIMTPPRSKSEGLSETCKTHLADVFVSAMYGRREDASGKALEKGNEREEDSITLLSVVTKKLYLKNDQRLYNDFIQGEPDLFLGEKITTADETNDTKTSWSAHTFFRASCKPLEKMYWWQGQGYMDLTGAKKHTVSYCLVNGTAKAIMDEKRRLAYAMGVVDNGDEEYMKRCRQIEVNHIFDMRAFMEENPGFDFDNNPREWKHDIPIKERLFQFKFNRDQAAIDSMHAQVEACREFIKSTFINKAYEKVLL